MSLKAFSPVLVLEKPATGKERDKTSILCVEACGRNLYTGTKDCIIQHFVLLGTGGQEAEWTGAGIREARKKQFGSRGTISQLGVIPVLNHLLVLCDGSLSALNMFSLEPLPGLRRIRNMSFFHLAEATGARAEPDCVTLLTASARRRGVSVHTVGVDMWECVREVTLPQEPVALAADGDCLCVATGDRYILHDHKSGTTLDLFPHESSKHAIIVKSVGKGEFLLHSPGSLGVFVTSSGVSQRPPVQWPEGVLGAAVHFPYVLTLHREAVHVYSMLDQRLKQTIPLLGGRGLLSASESVFVFTEREVHSLSPVPLERQIEALLGSERMEEALDLVQGAKSQLPENIYKGLRKNITCTAGFVKFYQECFSEAEDLFIKGDIDPREIICLYPELYPLDGDYISQHAPVFNAKDLRVLREDHSTFRGYQDFLIDFLRVVRGTDQSYGCRQVVDGALLKLCAERGESEDLLELVSSPNDCILSVCVPQLKHYKRFFTLGLLYQSHGQDYNAIQTWVDLADGDYPEGTNPRAYEHIVNLLCQQKRGELVWKFADWALQKNQEVGVKIFTEREQSQNPLGEEDILGLLNKHPLALELYLEHMVHGLGSKKERHHTLLATTYVTRVLQLTEEGGDLETANGTRDKFQRFLQESTFYDIAAVQERIQATSLHVERAIVHGAAGEHHKALHILVHEERDPRAGEDYCRRASAGRPEEFGRALFLALLEVHLGSPDPAGAVADLLNRNTTAFDPVSVLQALPGSWSLQLVARFLSESVRGTFHRRKMGGVERSLAQVEHLRLRYTRATVTRGVIKVERGRICQRCGRYLTEPEFLRSLKGELIHTYCWSREPPSNAITAKP